MALNNKNFHPLNHVSGVSAFHILLLPLHPQGDKYLLTFKEGVYKL